MNLTCARIGDRLSWHSTIDARLYAGEIIGEDFADELRGAAWLVRRDIGGTCLIYKHDAPSKQAIGRIMLHPSKAGLKISTRKHLQTFAKGFCASRIRHCGP